MLGHVGRPGAGEAHSRLPTFRCLRLSSIQAHEMLYGDANAAKRRARGVREAPAGGQGCSCSQGGCRANRTPPAPTQAADTTDYNLTDYRILGHMMYKSSSSSSCADSFIVACGYVGNFTLRLSPNSIKILPPAVSVAFFRGEVIGCPSGAGSVTCEPQ